MSAIGSWKKLICSVLALGVIMVFAPQGAAADSNAPDPPANSQTSWDGFNYGAELYALSIVY